VVVLLPSLFDQYIYYRQLKECRRKEVPALFKEAYDDKMAEDEAPNKGESLQSD